MTQKSENGKLKEDRASVVLRLLNTPLAGCEYSLQNTTLFIVGDEKKLASIATEMNAHEAERIICLPIDATFVADSVVNFEIIIDPQALSAIYLQVIHPSGSDKRAIGMQQIITAGAVKFALRYEDEAWDQQVLTPAVSETFSRAGVRPGWYKLAMAGIVLLLLGGIAAGSLAYVNRQERQIITLGDQIKHGVSNYQIYAGRDKTKYIVLDNERDYNWVLQSLVKMPPEFKVQVITLPRLTKKITCELEGKWPEIALRRIELSDDNQIQLIVSDEKNKLPDVQQNAIRQFINQRLPWSKKIVFQRIHDRVIEEDADKVVAVIPGYVEKIRLIDRLTYRITGELDDAQLQKIKQGITAFENYWGNSYIDFVISQKHDCLKNKSFKYGDEGYIKLKPGHWYFTKPIVQE